MSASGNGDARRLGRLAQADLLLLAAEVLLVPGSKAARDRAAALPDVLPLAWPSRRRVLPVLGQPATHPAGAWRRLGRSLADADPAAWEEEHAALFDGVALCPAHEASWIRRDKGALLTDIAGFYRAFGIEVAAGAANRPDHLGCELEFLALLLVMEVNAERAGDVEAARVTREAFASFIGDHLGEWIGAFCERLREYTELALFARLGDALEASFAELCRQRGLPGPQAGLQPSPEDDTPQTCGMEDSGLA